MQIILKNIPAETGKIVTAVNLFAEENSLSDEIKFDVNLALNEVVTNIISYAFDDKKEHKIILELAREDKYIIAKIEDDGKPFNPLDFPPPDTDLELESREIGGLGVFFVKELTDKVEYERKNGKNILTLYKKV